jgi:hypothetical protein
MHIQFPNSSFYPEIDFASKCVEVNAGSGGSHLSMASLMYPLSNSNSSGIRARINQIHFYVSAEFGHIGLNLKERSGALVRGQKYT